MIRLRNVKRRVCRTLSDWMRGRAVVRDTGAMDMPEITTAIHLRQRAGHVTTLRQLHKVCELTQPEALTVIAELEHAGIVLIEHNVADAFESTVSLTEEARLRLERVSHSTAAQGIEIAG